MYMRGTSLCVYIYLCPCICIHMYICIFTYTNIMYMHLYTVCAHIACIYIKLEELYYITRLLYIQLLSTLKISVIPTKLLLSIRKKHISISKQWKQNKENGEIQMKLPQCPPDALNQDRVNTYVLIWKSSSHHTAVVCFVLKIGPVETPGH